MKNILCDWLLTCVLSAQPFATPADLDYRAALDDYHQERRIDAAVVALNAERRNSVADAAADADWVRHRLAVADLLFKTGMSEFAQDVLATLDADSLAWDDRARLAMLWARIYYGAQAWDDLDEELAAIAVARQGPDGFLEVPGDVESELAFLRAELATARHEYVPAEASIAEIAPDDANRAYALFNLGVALKKSGSIRRAERTFEQLATMDVFTEDALDLKHRALVALSFIKRQHTETASAEEFLRQVPAQSRYRDMALATYGMSAMEGGDYQVAARIWSSIMSDDPWSAAGITAQLAYPMSLEQIDSADVALAQYQTAAASFEARLAMLRDLSDSAGDSAWIVQLLRPSSDGEVDSHAMQEWRKVLGHRDWLAWLSGEPMRSLVDDWRELETMSRWLAQVDAGRLDALESVTVEETTDMRERAAGLAESVDRLLEDRRSRLGALVNAELERRVAIAERQLQLARLGIARTADRVVADDPGAGQ